MQMKKSVNIKKVITCYWETVRHYRWVTALSLVSFGVASSFSNVAVPIVYRSIIDALSNAQDRADLEGPLLTSFWYLAALVLGYNILYRIGDYSITYLESRVMKDLSDRTLETLERHSYKFFSDNFTGGLVAKSRRFVRTFESLYDNIVFTLWTSLLNIIGIFAALFWTAPAIGWVFLFWTCVYMGIVWILTKKKSVYDADAAEHDSRVSARLSDSISNMLVIKMFASGKREKSVFGRITSDEEKVRRKAWNYQNLISMMQGVLMMILELGGMYIALNLWLSGKISTGTVVLVQIYIAHIFGMFWQFGRIFGKMARTFADAEEMVDIFELDHDISDPKKPEAVQIQKGDILIDDIVFRYGEAAPVFEKFSMHIRSGEKVGLVGTSGAGKSTITKLLLRFIDPQSGSIRIDGQDIKNIRQDDVRSVIAYVPQDPALFHRTLRENIAYGKSDATDEEIIEAAKKAHAHEFIEKLPKGYETLVGERGVKLSGGERQRVALARAVLKNAPILVLDEATSSLDTVSEKLIQDALDELMKGKTVIVIAHRLSTVRKMDRIIVLENGAIVEEGSHEELVVRKDGAYADLWRHQTDGFIE